MRWWHILLFAPVACLDVFLDGTSDAAPVRRPATPQPPTPQELSRTYSEQALSAHDRNDHAEALRLFLLATAQRPTPQLRSFVAREHHELAQYNEARVAAKTCLAELSESSLAARMRGEVRLSCLWFQADSLYQMKDLSGASEAAEQCMQASRDDTESRNRDTVFLDCERLSRALESIREQERTKGEQERQASADLVEEVRKKEFRPLHKKPLFWLGLGAATALTLGVGLGVGLRPPEDPADIRNLTFSLSF